ncbi:MAG: hypothetical protein EA428_01340 [Spirochaetaceae bacterium]|nr:MAG: hypothetical protein EA428_01340 [Spirochaetaceae bacterium]
MSNNTRTPAIDEAALQQHIEDILRRIEEEEDPQELNAYRRLFKKHVPLFRRGYFAGFIIKHGLLQDENRDGRPRPKRSRREATRKDEPRNEDKKRPNARESAPSPQQETDTAYQDDAPETSDSGLTSVFVGVGKNRRVYPKDLIQLFSEIENIETADIGQIKILDNYSFVEVNPEKAQSAIEHLNGSEYRGRKVTVNFARRKD